MNRFRLALVWGFLGCFGLSSSGLSQGTTWATVREAVKSKPVRAATFLVAGGQPKAVIAVPDDPSYRPLAAKLREALNQHSKVQLDIVDAVSLVEGAVHQWKASVLGGNKHLILLGDLSSNLGVARLYMDFYAFEDATFPGPGGHTVRTLLDPYGAGWNAVVLGGSSPVEVQGAVEEYTRLIRATDEGVWTDYCFNVTWGQPAKVKAVWVDTARGLPKLWDEVVANSPLPANPTVNDLFSLLGYYFANAALGYGTSGHLEFARTAGQAVDRAYELLDRMDHESANYDAHYSVEVWLRAWQQVANCPHLTDEQRRRGRALMALFAVETRQHLPDLTAYGKAANYGARILSRHGYSGIFAGHNACRYALRHCDLTPEIAAVIQNNREKFDVVVSTMLQSFCTGYDHKWMFDGQWHLLQTAVEEPRPAYVESGLARLNADLAAMCIANNGEWVNFGAFNNGPFEIYDAWQIFGRAETLFRDGSYQWWLTHKMLQLPRESTRHPYKTFIAMPSYGHWYVTDRPATEPKYMIGLTRCPMSVPLYEDLVAGRGALSPGLPSVNEVPLEKTFHKIAFRDGLGSEDQYLLLDGLGGTTYSGNDANEITCYARYGKQLIVPIEAKPDSFYRNTVSVSRGNEQDPAGTFAEVLDMAELGPLLYTRTEVDPLLACVNQRHIFMERGGYVVVLDDVVTKQDDEQVLSCNFRAPGEPLVGTQPGDWQVRNDTVLLRLLNLPLPGVEPAPSYTTGIRTSGLSAAEWEFEINNLHQTAARRFDVGEKYRFANVLIGTRLGEETRLEARALTRDAVLVSGVVYGAPFADSVKLGSLEIRASAFRLSKSSAQFVRLRSLTMDGKKLLAFRDPLTVSLDFKAGTIVLQSPESRRRRGVEWEPLRQKTDRWAEAQRADFRELALRLGRLRQYRSGQPATDTQPVAEKSPLRVEAQRVFETAPGGTTVRKSALCDLNGDGREEIILACRDGAVIAVDLQEGQQFTLRPSDSPLRALWAGRINDKPVILCGADTGMIYAYDAAGTLLWQYQNTHGEYASGVVTVYSFAVADFDEDGADEIAVGVHSVVLLLDADGTLLDNITIWCHGVDDLTPVRLFGNSRPILLANAMGFGVNVVDPLKDFFLYSVASGFGWHSVALRLHETEESDQRILAATRNGICSAVLRKPAPDQSPGWNPDTSWWKLSDGETGAALLCDLNGQAPDEILTGTETGFLVAYDSRGNRLWKHLVGTPVKALALLDVDHDGSDDFIIGGDSPCITVCNKNRKRLAAWQPNRPFSTQQLFLVKDGLYALSRSGEVVRLAFTEQ